MYVHTLLPHSNNVHGSNKSNIPCKQGKLICGTFLHVCFIIKQKHRIQTVMYLRNTFQSELLLVTQLHRRISTVNGIHTSTSMRGCFVRMYLVCLYINIPYNMV